jgi:hypothetical protein
MRIAKIQTGATSQANHIRSAFGQKSSSVLVEQFKIAHMQPLPSVFIRAVVNSNILTEAEGNILTQLFKAGIAKLKAAMTPGTSEDLELLLTMMAPQGGGVEKVEQLLDAARQGPIHDNEDWWNSFYEAFNIQDDLVKQDIRDRVSTEIPGAKPNKPQVPGGEEVGGNKFQDFVNRLGGQRKGAEAGAETGGKFQDFADRLGGLEKRQQDNRARADEIRKRMAELQGQQQSEETQAVIGTILCEMNSVRTNFSIVSNLMHAEIRAICEGKVPRFDDRVLFNMLSEGMLDDIRTRLANPNYSRGENDRTAQKYGRQAELADGERVAKLAINVAKQQLRQKFNASLQDAGLLPNDIAKSYATWKKLSQVRNKDQKQLAEYQIATKKLKQAMELFQPMMPNAPKEDPADPLDPGEPEIVDPEEVEVVEPASKEAPHYIGDDEPEPKKEDPYYIGDEPEKDEDYKQKEQVARKVGLKMMQIATKTHEQGGDVHYAVRSYLMRVHRSLWPELAEYLWGQWKEKTGAEGDLG